MGGDYTSLQNHGTPQGVKQNPLLPNSDKPNPTGPGRGSTGCIIIVIAAAFFAAMGAAIYLYLFPGLFEKFSTTFDKNEKTSEQRKESGRKVTGKKSFDGVFMDAMIVPDENGKEKLWVYTNKYDNPGYMIYTYIYDPYENKILKEYTAELDNYPPQTKLFLINNEVWKVNTGSKGIEPGIFIYDPLSGKEKMNTQAFISEYPELSAGISQMYIYDNPPKLDIETKDGRKPVFDMTGNKLYINSTEYRNSFTKDKRNISIFALGIEKSGEDARKTLYLVTGPNENLRDKNVSEHYFSSPSTLKFMTKSEAKPLIKDKVFLEGVMLYQDDGCCFVFHQTQAGSNAERLLSCINKEGNILWTASTEDGLFAKLKATDKDAVTGMFFIKHNVHVSRSGNLVLFNYDRIGFIGFDYKTGNIVFREDMSG